MISEVKNYETITSEELIAKLKEEYGPVPGDYFVLNGKGNLVKNGSIVRTDKGLFVHHIAENKAHSLSDIEIAKQEPLEYQKAENLVYCNYIEHFLIHIKYFIETEGEMSWNGCIKIDAQLNNMFVNGYHPRPDKWKYNSWVTIQDYMQLYFELKEYFIRAVMQVKQLDRPTAFDLIEQAENDLGWYK